MKEVDVRLCTSPRGFRIPDFSGNIRHQIYIVHPFLLSLTRDPLARLHDLQELVNVTLSCCEYRDATAQVGVVNLRLT